jgi:hypothetical protein
MVEVEVQNKEQPTVVAPPTIVVSCDFWFDINALTDPNDPTFGRVVTDLSFREKVKTVDIVCPEWCEPNFKFNYFPPAGIEDKCALYDPVHPEFTYEHLWGFDGYVSSSCGSNPTIIVNDQRECGQGRITRTISVPGQNGPVTATQTIYFVDCNPYYITDENCFNFDDEDGVIWPCDMELRECEASTDPSITGRPTILNEDNCSLVAVKYEDEVFDVVPNACFKIIRTWTILDWCQYDPSLNLTTGRWEYEQIILVNDARKPVLEGCADVTFCDESAEFSAALNACVGYASLSLDSVVDCTPYESLVFEYKIDAFNDGTYDFISSEYGQVVDNNPLADDESNARDASGKYPLGTHRIKWFVEDMCGNLQTCEYLFTVEDCKNPTPYCRTGIVTVVMELSGEVEVWARDLDVGSFDNCPGDLEFHFDSLGLEEGRVFDCDDLGTTQVEIWVTDASGNKDFCTTTVEIQDPNGACGSTIRAEIAGTLESRTNDPVGQAVMTLYDVSKQAMQQMTTDQTGKFSFRRLPIDQIYTVKPERNDDPLNGVSTRDLIFIQRHLLGIEELGDPMKFIAADVNNSKGVSAKDLVELRKLILGLYNGFDEMHTDQRSWRFMDKKHVITDPVFPYDFPESVTFEPLTQPELNTHFTGIKIGDIDGNARANNLMPIESRSNQTIHLQYQDRPVRQGERVVIPVTSADFRDIVGMQFTLNFNMELVTLTDIHSGVLELNESNLGMHLLEKGMATFSWNSELPMSSSEDEVLFTLVAEVNKDASLKDVFHISSRVTTAEAYQGLAYEPVQVVMNEDDTDAKQGFALLQNVPNPFSEETIIGYILPNDMDATLSIYDQNGKVLWLQVFDAVKGYNEVIIKSSELPAAGILYYQLDTETFTDTKRMVHIR